jgi:hypothetical protein
MSIQFKKRSGSTIREYNINTVVEMLKKGMTEKDIMTLLAMSFCPDTRTDYLNTAKEKLEMENSAITEPKNEPKEESFIQYAKSKPNRCKTCGKPIPATLTFCSEECKEKCKQETEKQ